MEAEAVKAAIFIRFPVMLTAMAAVDKFGADSLPAKVVQKETRGPSQCESMLSLLEEEISRLDSKMESLMQRLAPVMTTSPPLGATCDEKGDVPLVPVANEIRGAGRRVHNLCELVDSALDRVQV